MVAKNWLSSVLYKTTGLSGPEISGHVTQIPVISPYTSRAGLYEQQWEVGFVNVFTRSLFL